MSLFNLRQRQLGETTVELGDKTYGARADRREPIGGGPATRAIQNQHKRSIRSTVYSKRWPKANRET